MSSVARKQLEPLRGRLTGYRERRNGGECLHPTLGKSGKAMGILQELNTFLSFPFTSAKTSSLISWPLLFLLPWPEIIQ